jgi:hypothetical protein
MVKYPRVQNTYGDKYKDEYWKMYNKNCKNCNIFFKSKSYNRVYCSKECRSTGYRNVVFKYDKNIYEDGFNYINSYIFGFIMSDGCLYYDSHSRRYRIAISSNDLHILESIKEYCGINRKIYKNKNGYTLIYISQEAIDFLSQYGLKERKSLISEFHSLGEEFMPHFIRGYFDGDGSISTNRTKYGDYQQISITCASVNFINGLNSYFRDMGFSSNIYNESKKRIGSNTKYIKISRTDNISKFYKMIYNDDTGEFYLKRKKDKFIYK